MFHLWRSNSFRHTGAVILLGLASVTRAVAQKRIPCPDGEHIEIDVRQISIQYGASTFAGTLGSLSALGARLEITPKRLQEVAVATQQWDEFLKGLAAGYNTCAVTREQYADGLNRIYPRLQEDGSSLEQVRKAIANGQKIDAQHLQRLIDSFSADLRQFAQLSGKEIILERISALADQQKALSDQEKSNTERILAKLDELKQMNLQAPLATPPEIKQQISDIRRGLLTKADNAEVAYNKGYALLNQYHFAEAIPYLQQAVADVPLPDFYLALGRSYYELSNLGDAERVIREGLKATPTSDEEYVARLESHMGVILEAKGDLGGALQYTQRALKIGERLYGPDHPIVAVRANNIGQILQDKGDLGGALQYTQRALKIDEKVYGPDNPDLAVELNNIGQILKDKGNLDGALQYTRRALKIDEKVYGPDHPIVAVKANNIGAILQDKGELDGALQYSHRALKIDEKVYGPDHPIVARDDNNIGLILKAKGDLNSALQYVKRALKIDEKVYGPDHHSVAINANNIGLILTAKGDLDGALQYFQRALKIDEKVYGPDYPAVAIRANNISQILKAKGDLDGALQYAQRALRIDEKVYGPDHPSTKAVASNVAEIRKLRSK